MGQTSENSIAVKCRTRNSVSQRFLFEHGGCEVSVCLQKNRAAWKGCTQ